MAGRTITATARIVGKDDTGSAFDSVAKKIAGVAKAASQFGRIKPIGGGSSMGWGETFEKEIDRMKVSARELGTIQKSWESFHNALGKGGRVTYSQYGDAIKMWKDKTLSSLREVRSGLSENERLHNRFFSRARNFALQAAGIGAAGYAANRGVRALGRVGAASNRQDTLDWMAGLRPDQSKEISDTAARLSSKYPSLTGTTLHQQLRDFEMSVGDMDKMKAVAETIAQGATVLQALKGKDAAIEETRKFFKALDVLGKNVDPKDVKELYSGFVRAIGVEGADMNMADVLQLAKKSRLAGGALSNRFLMTSGAAIMQDLGAQETGTALASGLAGNIGKRATKTSLAAQTSMGIRGKGGKLINESLYLSDPDLWAWQVLKPALEKKGIKMEDERAVVGATSKLFSRGTVGDIFGKFLLQESQYRRKTEQYALAKGPGAATELGRRDIGVAASAFTAQLENLAAALAKPVFETAASRISAIAGALGSLSEKISTKGIMSLGPQDAATGGLAVAGAAATGAMGWFAFKGLAGLATAGPALTGAATALDASAAALTRAALAIGTGGKVGAAATAGGAASAGIWGTVAGGAAAAVPWLLAGGGVAGGLWAMHQAKSEAGTLGMTGAEGAAKIAGGRNRTQILRDWANEGRERLGLPALGGGTTKLEAEGEVTGQAELTVKVEPSTELLRIATQAKAAIDLAGRLRAQGTGSTGRSSPDAAPWPSP